MKIKEIQPGAFRIELDDGRDEIIMKALESALNYIHGVENQKITDFQAIDKQLYEALAMFRGRK